MTAKKAICTFSGGYDSTAAMLWSLDRYATAAMFVDYGQPYLEQEVDAAKRLLNMDAIQQHPNYDGVLTMQMQLALRPPGDRWVPYRNLIIASIATNVAAVVEEGIEAIIFGSKSAEYREDDPVSFKDSTVQFYQALRALIVDTTEPHHPAVPQFLLPLVGWDKRNVLRYLQMRGIDIRQGWNCYREDGVAEPCGECEHCLGTQPLVASVRAETWCMGCGTKHAATVPFLGECIQSAERVMATVAR